MSLQANNIHVNGSTINYVAGNQVNNHNLPPDGQPPRVFSAAFESLDAEKTVRCLEGTRVDILDQVYRWLGSDDVRSGDVDRAEDARIFWINGSAGTGKTTIAYTVAEACSRQGILGASFFCSRNYAERSNTDLIFTTVAHQLGLFSPPFKVELARALQSNPDIIYSSVPYQLERLIVNPLRAVRQSIPCCVIILDALDECKDNGATSIILSSLSRYITDLSPLKILVTSRPEQNITTVFKSPTLGPASQRLVLHEVELGVVQHDIEHYLTSKLSLIREAYGLENSWPAEADVQALAMLSHGLFIFAATSVNFIQDRNDSSPRSQLADLLLNSAIVAERSSSPHRHLDRLYTQVMEHAFPEISPGLLRRMKIVLGTIIFLKDPLSPPALELLLHLTQNTVRETLAHLQSVIIVPENDMQIIRLLHPSFFDFLTDPMRCRNSKFVMNAEAQHTLLAHACLQAMRALKRDICGIRNPFILNNEVNDLPSRIAKCIPPQVQYACRHWAWHLTNATMSERLLDLMKEFSSKYLLFWVEVCSLLGELRTALIALHDAQQLLVKKSGHSCNLITLLYNGERFTREFFPVLSISSLQVYHSALLFTPRQTMLHRIYKHELVFPAKRCGGVNGTWNLCTRTMEGHSGIVDSVAFSPNGMCIVSGSRDKTIRMWDTVSGAHLNTLKGHFQQVSSVSFSPDGKCVVSGSLDGTLQLWDAVNGAHLNTFEGHPSAVASVSFSPNARYIVSGSWDNTIQLWDAVSGAHLNTLEGHSGDVNSVSFSPDGRCIVSGSEDRTVQLWDAVSGAHLNTLKGHSQAVKSVSFSPDGRHIVSGSGDMTIRLWKVSGTHLRTLKGHSDWVVSISFSPNGRYIISGSWDKTIQQWDAVSGAHLNTLEGHSVDVQSVSISPDNRYIVSGSWDKTIQLWSTVIAPPNIPEEHSESINSMSFSPERCIMSGPLNDALQLWDTVRGVHLNMFKGHSDCVNSVSFSPDSRYIVSGSKDKTIRLWDAVSGAHLNTLKGHSQEVSSVSFSPDGKCIVSGSWDRTLQLWDAVNGAHLNTFKGHTSLVTSVSFSPNARYIVSGSWDKTIRQWDAVSGAHLKTLEGHSKSVYSVSFSPDGRYIVSGSADKTVRLWDAVSGAHLKSLKGHSESVKSVSFSLDGRCIVSGSSNKTLRLWDASSGLHLDTIKAHSSFVCSVAHSLNFQQTSFSNGRHITPGQRCTSVGCIINDEGWFFSLNPNQRLCWIPLPCRPYDVASSGDYVAFGNEDGHLVIFDLTSVGPYL